MPLPPPPLSDHHVLLIDDMAPMRGLLREQLTTLNIKYVVPASSGEEALNKLRAEKFHLVVCDYNLGRGPNGQQVLEQAKEQGLLPSSTVWIMVTAESGHNLVSVAADDAPDDYIIKPFSSKVLLERFQRALAKRQALQPFYDALDHGQVEAALQAASAIYDARGPFHIEAAKQKGKLLLRKERFGEALALYDDLLAQHSDLPFAQLARARALKGLGELAAAEGVALELRAQYPDLIGACDLLVDIFEATGRPEQALAVAQQAADIIPSGRRNLSIGKKALAIGDTETAFEAFSKASSHSALPTQARIEDVATLLQAYIHHDNPRRALELLPAYREQFKGDAAARLVLIAIEAQAQLWQHRNADSEPLLQQLTSELDRVPLDTEAKMVCLTAFCMAAQEPEAERLTQELTRDFHAEPIHLKQIRTSADHTPLKAKIELLVDKTAHAFADELKQTVGMLINQGAQAALDRVNRLLEQAPHNPSVHMLKVQCLIRLLAATDRPVQLAAYAEAVNYLVALKAISTDLTALAKYLPTLGAAMKKARDA
ncbi:response regulator [Macromonas bipunctata]|uniref:response regulator n=1 Tax=Macromonas bipunctata TaxID=183670 RepID=UPI001474CDD6|nr:response regulator [Macromonas bipunctata]